MFSKEAIGGSGNGLYEFGPFRLDPEDRLLLRNGSPVSLTPKTFDTLLLLVESSGKLVPKDELMRALWPDSFVDESNLTQTVFMLRKALGETGSDQRYILTASGRGYRFAANVRQVSSPEPGVDVLVKMRPSRRWPVLVVAVISLVLVLITLPWSHSRIPPPRPSGRIMLAVLPFENLTGDAGQDYFSDGLTEEMIIRLERLDRAPRRYRAHFGDA